MENIVIDNPALLKEKLDRIKKDGTSHFHVISDFDRTLTPAFIDGKKAETSYGQIRAGGYLSPEYVQAAYALKEKYYPIEIDESITVEKRSKIMIEWWQKHLEMMVKYGLNKHVMDDIVKKGAIRPRDGSMQFYDLLHEKNIPLIIFSAGQGDLIEEFLKREGKLYNNIHLIANMLDFDEEGKVRAYKSDIIHTFNKNEGQIKKTRYYEQIKNRKNVVVIGDNLEDAKMTEGLSHETVLRISFLNEHADKLLAKFQKIYDIVLLNDSSMDYVNDLLKDICK